MEAAKTTINTQLSTVQAAFQTSINTVHTALLDSVWGFKDCATVIPDARLKTKFDAVAAEREGMVKELEVRGGATPSTSGSVKGSLNRLWTKIKSSLSSGGIQHVLDDLAQEEADLKKLYETALSSEGIDSALNGVLNSHLKNIATHLSELRIICGEAKYSDKWDVSTPSTGEVLKDKLSTTGTTIKDTLTTTGQSISSAVATGGVALKDKLGYGTDTTATTTTTDTTTDTTSASTTGIKDKLVATGTVVKDNLVAAGTVIKDKFNEYTEGQDIKGQLAAAGTTIQGHLQTAGTAISTQLGNLSLGGQSQNPTGDKLTTELQKTTPVEKPAVTGTAGQEGTTGSDIKDKLQATGTYIKENLQAAGTAAGTALQSASATVQDKLGMQSQPTGEQLQDINATAAKLAQVNQEIHATVPTVPAATVTTAPASK